MAKKILKTAMSIGTFGLAGKLLGGKKKSKPEAGPIVMPIADDEATLLARKRAIAKRMSAGGRSSTILSDGDTLGGV